MLETLSEQERTAIAGYEALLKERGILRDPFIPDSQTRHFLAERYGGGEVVDVGCGTGGCSSFVMHDICAEAYFGIDASAACVAACKTLFEDENFTFEHGDFRTLGIHYSERFSAFVAVAALMHLPPDELGLALFSVRTSLKDGAAGVIMTPAAIGKTEIIQNILGMPITVWAEDDLVALCEQNDFRVHVSYQTDLMCVLHLIAT